MSTIDERIVQMKFDNKQFESGVQTSLKSLDNLKKGLNLDESAKSLQNLEKAGKSFSLASLVQGVENISGKFSALGIIGVTALQNITNSAVDAGKRIVSALTIDPIKMGFSEYETQINAVQTILANTSSKGKTLQDVNAALDELNAYADKTIYNFTEMTRNIGTFTAAGVDLDTSVQAIKGIANLAAVSGSTSQQASTAMYQLSQALASGTVKLMDWNSVVNAGMGGQVFQDALKETARVHGVKIDAMIKKEGSFRETLQNGWLTSEILTETLAKFTGDLNEEQLKTMGYTKEQIKSIMEMGQTANDAATKVKTFTQLFDTLKEAAQSGWTQSWEIIVGDFEEAKMLLTEVSNVFGAIIGSSAEARNSMLQGWKDLGGRSALIESVRNAFHGILDVIKPVKEAFREIFPPMTGQDLFNLTEGLRKLSERFKIGETTANNLKRTFKGVFALIDIGVEIVSSLAKGFFDLIGYVKPAGDGILGFTAGIGDFIVSLRDALKASDGFNNIINNITKTLGGVITWITNFVGEVAGAMKEFATIDTSALDKFTDKIKMRFEPFKALGEFVTKIYEGIVGLVQRAMPIVYSFSRSVAKIFSSISDELIEAFNNADYNNVLDMVNTGLLGGILFGVNRFIKSFGDIAKNASGFLEGMTDILDGLKDTLAAYQSTLKAKTLLTIAGAIGILSASLVALSLVDSEKLSIALVAVTAMFAELFGSMAIFEKIMGGAGFKGMLKVTSAMIPLATAVLILSAAMNKLAQLDWTGLTKGLVGVATLSATLVISAKSLSKSSGKLIKGSTGLVVFASAILVLSSAVEKLGNLDIKSLAKGLGGVALLCTTLSIFLNKTDFDGMGLLKGAGLMMLAGALNILGSAVEKIGILDLATWAKGLLGVGILLGVLGLFINGTLNAKHVISTAIGMTILGGAMLIFGEAVEKMGNLSLPQIGKGLTTMSLALLAVGTAMNMLPPGMVTKGLGMVAVAGALVILSNALQAMGSMSIPEIAKSLVTLSVSLLAIGAAMVFMNGTLGGAAALLVVAGALAILAPVLKTLGKMSLPEIGKGLLALAGVFAVIGVAGLLLAPLVPTLLGLGAAITLFGVGCVAVGAGVLLFSTALSALAISGVAASAALVTVVTSIVGMIPMIVEQIGIAIVVFANKIAEGGVSILAAVTTLLLTLIAAVVAVTPQFVDAILFILTTLLKKIAEYVPEMIQAGFEILIGFLKGIRDNIEEVVEVAIDIILEFLDGVESKLPDIVDAGYDLIIAFIDGLAESTEENTPRLVESIINLGKSIILGLINALKAGVSGVVEAIKEIGQSLIDGFKELLGINSPSKEFNTIGGYVVEGLINGLKDKITSVKDAAVELGSSLVNAVKNFLGIESPSKVMRDQVGKFIVQGIAVGIEEDTSAEDAAKIKAKNIVNAFKEEFDKFDLDASTADLEHKLWEALKGENATDAEKESAQLTTLMRKMEAQTKNVELAQGEYDVTMKTFGKASEETQTAYNKFLQEQIELAELVNQINEIQKTAAERQVQAKQDYYDYIVQNKENLEKLGFSLEAIKKEAEAVSGYKPEAMEVNMTDDISNAVTKAMSTVEQVYSENAEATFGGLLNNYSNWGVSYANAMSDAIREKSPLVQDATRNMIISCIAILKESKASWYEAGKELASSFSQGLNQGIAEAKQAMSATVTTVAQSTQTLSDPMYDSGYYADNQLAQGIYANSSVVEKAASQTGNKAASSFNSALSIISTTFGAILNTTPTIKPVVDLSNVVSSSGTISKLLGGGTTINATTSRNNASSISNSNASSSKSATRSDTPIKDTVVSFVQNISSPKAVSTTEVYRQTKSLFSSVKGLVTGK